MRRTVLVLALASFLAIGAFAAPFGFAETATVRVSGTAPIRQGDVARAQEEALDAALGRGLETVLIRIVSQGAFDALEPLLRAKVLSRFQGYVANYQIVDRDVSDLAYTVALSVTIDTDILGKDLARLGVVKGPGSPPLTAVFVTVDAPVGLGQVRSLGSLAAASVSSVLATDGFTVIPALEGDEMGFRLLRPPQDSGTLASKGLSASADLAVGILFTAAGEVLPIRQNTAAVPLEISLQPVDVGSGVVLETAVRRELVLLGQGDEGVLSRNLGEILASMARELLPALRERYLAPPEKVPPVELVFEGSHDARSVRIALGEMLFRLGEEAGVVPQTFTPDRSVYLVRSEKGRQGIALALASSRIVREIFTISGEGEGLVLRKTGGGVSGVREYGLDVNFYRRLPVAGVENPDDVRKVEVVGWQEMEDNSGVPSANHAPVGEGILGRIDPQRDQDFFRFSLPDGAGTVQVRVEQTGPGEVRPRVRVFDGDGNLLEDRKARQRGRSLAFTFSAPEGKGEVLLCVEDHLGRYQSMFPYVLKVGSGGTEAGGEPP